MNNTRTITEPQPPTSFCMITTAEAQAEAVKLTMVKPTVALVETRTRRRRRVFSDAGPLAEARHAYTLVDGRWEWDYSTNMHPTESICAEANDVADRMLAMSTQRPVAR